MNVFGVWKEQTDANRVSIISSSLTLMVWGWDPELTLTLTLRMNLSAKNLPEIPENIFVLHSNIYVSQLLLLVTFSYY